MKKLYVSLLLMLFIKGLSSQVIVKITQSPNNPLLLGVINSFWADAASTGWSTPDLTNPANAIEAELMFVDDGVDTTIDANGNPIWQDACEPLINNLTGKIAVAYRSFCWHDIKANYAQQAGAIGLILINRDPGPFLMGGTTVGSSVTIPVVSIGSEEGDLLKDFIAMGGVHAFIGTKVGLNANDLGSSAADIVMSNHQAIPIFLANNGSEYSVDLGLNVFNPGSNPQTGITASVDVTYNGSSVYSNTSIPLNFTAPVGVTVDTIYADLGTFAPSSWNLGTYKIRYTINLANDEDSSDNIFNTSFNITNNVFAKSRVDTLNNPLYSTAYSLNETTTAYDDWESCLVFKNSNASRATVKGMTFSCIPINNVMANEIIEIRAYQWNDVFTDLSVVSPTFNSLTQLSDALHFYADETENGVNVYLPFNAPVNLLDNQKYLFCIYNASNELRLGYDVQLDYTATINNYLMPVAPVKTLPSGQPLQWYWAGFGFDATPSISVTMDVITGLLNNVQYKSELPYPNPARNMLNLPTRKNISGKVLVQFYDVVGKLVLSENKTISNEPLKVNVAGITKGTYVVKLIFSDGSMDNFKVAVSR